MLLNELLSFTLLEDLGALKFVDTKFRNALLKKPTERRVPQDSEYGYETKRVHVMKTLSGRGSSVSTVVPKTATAAIAVLDEADVIAALLIVDGQQVLGFRKTASKAGEKDAYTVVFDFDVDIDASTPALDAAYAELASSLPPGKGLVHKSDVTKGYLRNVLAAVLKLFKGKKLELKVIHTDAERPALSSARKEARVGSDFTSATFMKQAKAALQRRLDLFKSSKAVGVDRVEEVATAIREKGYLDKIKIGGYAYDLMDSNIRMDVLKNPKGQSRAYVEYQLNSKTPEYQELSKRWNAIYRENPVDGSDRERALAELHRPPERVKVLLKLERGAIVPDRVQSEEDF